MLLNKDVIIKPYHTEKSYGLRKLQEPSCLTFVVNKKSNKHEILAAFKAIYNIEPEKINILNRKPKAARIGADGRTGYTKHFKLAYIVLPKGVQIAITKDEMEEAVKLNNEKTSETSTKKVDVKADNAAETAAKKPIIKAQTHNPIINDSKVRNDIAPKKAIKKQNQKGPIVSKAPAKRTSGK